MPMNYTGGGASMTRGLLLLDVDGPLNPYAAKPTAQPPGYVTYRRTTSGGWYSGSDVRRHKGLRVWLHPEHGRWLLDLAQDTGWDLVWATTWQQEANERIGPAVGLPRLPVIEFPSTDLDPDRGWLAAGGWKWPAVAAYAAGAPLAWLDDEHTATTSGPGAIAAHRAARARFDRDRADTPTLLCHIDPQHGLRPDDLASIRTWAADLP